MIWGEVAEEFNDFKSIFVVFHKNKSTFTFYGNKTCSTGRVVPLLPSPPYTHSNSWNSLTKMVPNRVLFTFLPFDILLKLL